ncbi:MAG: hypothetical protein ACMXYC_03245 [Candidatus Woesearchaeota archaeon]
METVKTKKEKVVLPASTLTTLCTLIKEQGTFNVNLDGLVPNNIQLPENPEKRIYELFQAAQGMYCGNKLSPYMMSAMVDHVQKELSPQCDWKSLLPYHKPCCGGCSTLYN